jgi:adenosylmethionine-8-amino-7-oxononanoate aminotransferase
MNDMTNTQLNSPSNEELVKWDRDHLIHPWMATDDWRGYDNLLVEGGEGIYMWDAQGRRFIDGPGGMWCSQIGHGRQEMADAISAQVLKLAYTSPFTNTTSPAAILAKRLTELAPGDLNNVFFTTGGSTAVDSALRTMQYYFNRRGLPEKKLILAREKGYHGSTYLAHSVTGKERDNSHFDFETRLVHFLPDVNPYRRPDGMSIADWCDAKVADLQAAIDQHGADKIGAFIAEPILSSGGVIVPPEGYHKRTWEICRANDILYISDEVVTGFGRLGHWFSSQDVFGIVPDMITTAKGLTSGYLPMGALFVSDRVMEAISGLGEASSYTNGYTYSAHPVSCVAALTNMDIFENENILEHVREITPYFQQRLRDLADKFEIVGDARGMGLLGCIEGKAEDLEAERQLGTMIDEACEARGLIVRPLINMAVFSPPLISTREELDKMFDILAAALVEVQAKVMAA